MAKGKNGSRKDGNVLECKQRACHLDGHLNGRPELHGEETVPAADITISAFLLPKDELNQLTGDVHTHDSWFKKSGSFTEPTDWVTQTSGTFVLKHKYENCRVALLLGTDDEETVLSNVRIARVRLTPRPSGFTEMTFQVQTTTDDADAIARLWQFMDKDIDVAIVIGNIKGEDAPKDKAKRDQPELPMDHKADGDEVRPH